MRVRTARGTEDVGVLIARTRGRWRARIVTYPNVLWTAPGGRTTLKFVSDTAEEAERQAVAFIQGHCARRPSAARGMLVQVATAAERFEFPAKPSSSNLAGKRWRVALPVRYGELRASDLGATANVSAEGMFIAAASPSEAGSPLRILVEVRGCTMHLRGLVMWSRRRPEGRRPAGMGIRLLLTPAPWASFVESIS